MVQIIADSTCDLSQELLEKYNIKILPLIITLDNNSLKDGEEISPEQIYEWSDKTGKTPKTACPSLGDAIDFLLPFTKKGDDILFFGISEAMSSTCDVIRLAAENMGYKKIWVIDSKNLSTGIGLQIIKAAEMSKEGANVNQIINEINNIIPKVSASFVVDTLTYLYRGGRCSAVTSLLANTLKLKPKIIVKHGKMDVGRKYRGNQKSVIIKYVKDLKEDLMSADKKRVFITHSGCDDVIINEVYVYLKNLGRFEEVLITKAGGVISSHCGPNTLGVLFIINDKY